MVSLVISVFYSYSDKLENGPYLVDMYSIPVLIYLFRQMTVSIVYHFDIKRFLFTSILLLDFIVCNGGSCSGNGQCVNGVCECNRLYHGKFCQQKGIKSIQY